MTDFRNDQRSMTEAIRENYNLSASNDGKTVGDQNFDIEDVEDLDVEEVENRYIFENNVNDFIQYKFEDEILDNIHEGIEFSNVALIDEFIEVLEEFALDPEIQVIIEALKDMRKIQDI